MVKHGWLPAIPDFRDYSAQLLTSSNKLAIGTILPDKADARNIVPWINDQGDLGSCTANAGQSMMAYMNQLAYGKVNRGSRLYLYWLTRYLMNQFRIVAGDTGADLRNMIGALVMYGICPEKAWPYVVSQFDKEPPARLHNLSDDFRALKYYRHDVKGISSADVLDSIKTAAAARIPTVFGFTCYTSIDDCDDGKIVYPSRNDKVDGGHAVLCIGYDDKVKIGQYVGALLIQNSWGKGWGEDGFGWLPYQYVLTGLASDFWSVTSAAYLDTGQFGF